MTANEIETLHLLLAESGLRCAVFLLCAVAPWLVWAAILCLFNFKSKGLRFHG
jgi:hypothetical protein